MFFSEGIKIVNLGFSRFLFESLVFTVSVIIISAASVHDESIERRLFDASLVYFLPAASRG